jgi:hypothetical protein
VIQQMADGLFRFASQRPQLASGGSQIERDPTTVRGQATKLRQVQRGDS